MSGCHRGALGRLPRLRKRLAHQLLTPQLLPGPQAPLPPPPPRGPFVQPSLPILTKALSGRTWGQGETSGHSDYVSVPKRHPKGVLCRPRVFPLLQPLSLSWSVANHTACCAPTPPPQHQHGSRHATGQAACPRVPSPCLTPPPGLPFPPLVCDGVGGSS